MRMTLPTTHDRSPAHHSFPQQQKPCHVGNICVELAPARSDIPVGLDLAPVSCVLSQSSTRCCPCAIKCRVYCPCRDRCVDARMRRTAPCSPEDTLMGVMCIRLVKLFSLCPSRGSPYLTCVLERRLVTSHDSSQRRPRGKSPLSPRRR